MEWWPVRRPHLEHQPILRVLFTRPFGRLARQPRPRPYRGYRVTVGLCLAGGAVQRYPLAVSRPYSARVPPLGGASIGAVGVQLTRERSNLAPLSGEAPPASSSTRAQRSRRSRRRSGGCVVVLAVTLGFQGAVSSMAVGSGEGGVAAWRGAAWSVPLPPPLLALAAWLLGWVAPPAGWLGHGRGRRP